MNRVRDEVSIIMGAACGLGKVDALPSTLAPKHYVRLVRLYLAGGLAT